MPEPIHGRRVRHISTGETGTVVHHEEGSPFARVQFDGEKFADLTEIVYLVDADEEDTDGA